MHLKRVVFNTGQLQEFTEEGVNPTMLEAMDELTRPGGWVTQWKSIWRVKTAVTPGNAWVLIYHNTETIPALLAGVAWTQEGEETLWPELESNYYTVTEAMLQLKSPVPADLLASPITPPERPWMAVVMLPGMMYLAKEQVEELAHLERALGMAIALRRPEPDAEAEGESSDAGAGEE